MCSLIEFDNTTARIGIKSSIWHKKLQGELPAITLAFEKIFQREIVVKLELIDSSTPPKNDSVEQTQPSQPSNNITPITRTEPPPNDAPGAITPSPSIPSNNNGAAQKPKPQNTQSRPPLKPEQENSLLPPADEPTDEVTIAAQRLAHFFDGQVVGFTEDSTEIVANSNVSEEISEAEGDDDW
jgi:DNA polymerase-3 subunit gamma/tau